jgi:hypothetical protein
MANDMTYEELIKKHPGSLVEKIVTEVRGQGNGASVTLR